MPYFMAVFLLPLHFPALDLFISVSANKEMFDHHLPDVRLDYWAVSLLYETQYLTPLKLVKY
jgi:hypothetical protein